MADKKTAAAKAPAKKVTKKVNEVLTTEQIQENLAKLRADHLESRKSHRAGELVNPHVLTVQRKDIARALTALKQAQLAAAKEEN